MLDEQKQVEIFHAQTTNVRDLETTWKHINRQINSLIVSNNGVAIHANTKVLSLIYCALAEAVFSKLLHTPNGLPLNHITQVKAAANSGGVKVGWAKCLQLAMQRVQGAKSSHGANVERKFLALIEEFIFDPSLLRNKLAHGQWVVALNRENNAVNDVLTNEIAQLDVVELYRRKSALEKLALILADIIASPNKAHHRDYWVHLEQFEAEQREKSQWSMAGKVAQLRRKGSHRKRDA